MLELLLIFVPQTYNIIWPSISQKFLSHFSKLSAQFKRKRAEFHVKQRWMNCVTVRSFWFENFFSDVRIIFLLLILKYSVRNQLIKNLVSVHLRLELRAGKRQSPPISISTRQNGTPEEERLCAFQNNRGFFKKFFFDTFTIFILNFLFLLFLNFRYFFDFPNFLDLTGVSLHSFWVLEKRHGLTVLQRNRLHLILDRSNFTRF